MIGVVTVCAGFSGMMDDHIFRFLCRMLAVGFTQDPTSTLLKFSYVPIVGRQMCFILLFSFFIWINV